MSRSSVASEITPQRHFGKTTARHPASSTIRSQMRQRRAAPTAVRARAADHPCHHLRKYVRHRSYTTHPARQSITHVATCTTASNITSPVQLIADTPHLHDSRATCQLLYCTTTNATCNRCNCCSGRVSDATSGATQQTPGSVQQCNKSGCRFSTLPDWLLQLLQPPRLPRGCNSCNSCTLLHLLHCDGSATSCILLHLASTPYL